MSQNRTQCPSCQATYPMPDAKLGDPNARAKCGRCQQVFLLNENLVSPIAPSVQPVSKPAHVQSTNDTDKPSVRRGKRERITPTEGMIFDNMDGDSNNLDIDIKFNDSELDNFLNNDIDIQQPIQSTLDEQKTELEEDAWTKELLDDSKPSAPTQVTSAPTSQQNRNVDLDSIIPVAPPSPKKTGAMKALLSNKKPTAQAVATQKPIGSQLMWLVGCVLLVALLIAQYVLFNINTLIKNPTYANQVKSLCSIAKCIAPNADLNSFVIQAEHKNKPHAVDVILNITNQSNLEQLYPSFVVTLKDKQGAVVADFVANTNDYLSESQTTILGNQQKRVMLTAHSEKPASVVEIRPFYP